MRTFKSLLALIAMLLCNTNLFAHNFEVDGIYYNITSSTDMTVEVTHRGNYSSYYSNSVIIPESVTYNGNTYSVTSIGNETFCNCTSLTSVKIPNSVTSIGNTAFYNCTSLTSVEIPNSVISLGKFTFAYSGLTSVVIPNSITELESGVFSYCDQLKYVDLPNSLTQLSMHDPSSNWGNDGTFERCKSLVNIELPKSLKYIGPCAFNGCVNLKEIEIPANVLNIEYYAFGQCNSLTNIKSNIPAESLFSISDDTFYGINENCVLTVPYGARSTYEETEGWNVFSKIVEMADITLVDGVDFSNAEDLDADNITYTRNLPNLYWNALYVPFKIPYATLADDYEVAYINAVHSYDNNDDGTIDELSMEVMKIKAGTLKANYPYLIKARNEAAKAMTISVADAVLYAAEENTLDCSSVYQTFEITGSYSRKSAEDLEGSLAISTEGAWQPLATGTYLNPFRLYLTITNRNDSPVEVEPTALSRVRIIENGETTGILDFTPAVKKETNIFDLSGRRVLMPLKGQLYIVNGKKMVY